MKEIALNILDIAGNSVEAGSRHIWITICDSERENTISVSVRDDGPGIPEEIKGSVTDPFVTSRITRHVGLGIPLLKQQAEASGGGLEIVSEHGKGTETRAWFIRNHIDRQPMGDLPGTLSVLFRIDSVDIIFNYRTDCGEYSLSTQEMKTYLGINNLNNQTLLRNVSEMIRNNLGEISATGVVGSY